MIRIMNSREAMVENFDPFDLEKFPVPRNLIIDFTEKSNFQSDEIFLRRLKPSAQAKSAMITASSKYIISAFNYRFAKVNKLLSLCHKIATTYIKFRDHDLNSSEYCYLSIWTHNGGALYSYEILENILALQILHDDLILCLTERQIKIFKTEHNQIFACGEGKRNVISKTIVHTHCTGENKYSCILIFV